jgi:hypothetical protein
MSEIANPTSNTIEAAFKSNDANWKALCTAHEKLFGNVAPVVLYSLPESLIEALAKRSRGVLSDAELDFELNLSDALRSQHSIGFVNGRPIQSNLFTKRTAVSVSEADFDSLGWKEFGLTCEKVNQVAAEIESRALHIHDQFVAYAGWLITNPMFLHEVAVLRKRGPALEPACLEQTAVLVDREINKFLARWQLAGMTSWDLPNPQGPNLSGIALPASTRRGAEVVTLEMPPTIRLPARFPMSDLLSENRHQATQPHLVEWRAILDQEKDKTTFGILRFSQMLHLQFFRNIVLGSRYKDRFNGHLQALDSAFGEYLDVGAQSAQKLRLAIAHRLRRPLGDGRE